MGEHYKEMLEKLSLSLKKTTSEAESFLASLEIDNTNFKEVTELDFSGQNSLINVDFLSFFQKVNALNLSKCINLGNINGVANLTDLEELDLSWCESLESISDLTKCNKLTNLNLICTSHRLNPDAYDLLALVVLLDIEILENYEWDAEEDIDPNLLLDGEIISVYSEDEAKRASLSIRGKEEIYSD